MTDEIQSERPDEALLHRINIAVDVKRLAILVNWMIDHLNLRQQIIDEDEVAYRAASETKSKYLKLEETKDEARRVTNALEDIERLGR